jgi:hypothetical protein
MSLTHLQMIFPEFVEFLARRARAICGSSVPLSEAVSVVIGSDVIPKLQKCHFAQC